MGSLMALFHSADFSSGDRKVVEEEQEAPSGEIMASGWTMGLEESGGGGDAAAGKEFRGECGRVDVTYLDDVGNSACELAFRMAILVFKGNDICTFECISRPTIFKLNHYVQ
jgi:hypothetical protein